MAGGDLVVAYRGPDVGGHHDLGTLACHHGSRDTRDETRHGCLCVQRQQNRSVADGGHGERGTSAGDGSTGAAAGRDEVRGDLGQQSLCRG